MVPSQFATLGGSRAVLSFVDRVVHGLLCDTKPTHDLLLRDAQLIGLPDRNLDSFHHFATVLVRQGKFLPERVQLVFYGHVGHVFQ